MLTNNMERVKDNFYPNAIQCLMSLYLEKIQNLGCYNQDEFDNVWRDIVKDMQESFFEFTYEEIKTKFYSLWHEYIKTSSEMDTKNFEYFTQMREIHQVLLAKNFTAYLEPRTKVARQPQIKCKEAGKIIEIRRKSNSNTKLTTKEPLQFEEFDNLYLQSSKKSDTNEIEPHVITETKIEVIDDAQEFELVEDDTDSPSAKRPKIVKSEHNILTDEVTLPYELPSTEFSLQSESHLIKDMTITEFNEHQESRHQESLNLARQHLKTLEDMVSLQRALLKKL
ncbi:uncharacterized protein LOC119669893 [Teleopsis dalmanni]|uniref:uncharacterized protein LOC119669893 n=1 Tax=Teleopsis dalmanni TaxID=139649 RepID=UPI0018CEB418|nr:uncharacterized protein LOC119669893 [Teleopsis dalmanni]